MRMDRIFSVMLQPPTPETKAYRERQEYRQSAIDHGSGTDRVGAVHIGFDFK